MKKTMRKTMKNKVITFGAAALAILVGCSVKTGSVAKNPPQFKTNDNANMKAFSVTAGIFKPGALMSTMLWPEAWGEYDFKTKVPRINGLSESLGREYVGNVLFREGKINDLFTRFTILGCVEKYIVNRSPDDDREPLSEPSRWGKDADGKDEWKVLTAPADPQDAEYLRQVAELEECKANQPIRDQLKQDIKAYQVKIGDPNGTFQSTKREVAELVGEDGLTIKPDNSRIIFNADHIEVKIDQFAGSTKVQKSHTGNPDNPIDLNDATRIHDISFEKNQLTFFVPGSDKFAGQEFRFRLTRIDNLVEYTKVTEDGYVSVNIAVFKGDLSLMQDGKVLRDGVAQFIGALESLSPKPIK